MANTKVSGDLIQDGSILQSHLNASHGITTTDIGEGTALYYTDARVANYLTTNNYATQAYVGTITTNSTNWDTAYGWGDHSLVGYLTTETDPVFVASPAYGITSTNITNWNTAYGWGDHSAAGYLTSFTETDPVYVASSWYTTTNNATNWDTAYSWGNHATQSYATQTYVNTAVANLVDTAPTTLDTLNELAAALGDDPNFATTVSTSIGLKLDTSTWTASAASGITSTQVSNWDTAYSWGDHASVGYLTSFDITTQTDPKYLRSDANDTYTGGLDVSSGSYVRFGHASQSDGNDGKIGANLFASGLNIVGTNTGSGRQVRIWGDLIQSDGSAFWHNGNDGSGSGLDADLLDGNHASAFALASHTHNYWSTTGGDYTGNYKIGRHFDAQDVWDTTGNNRKALFLGWYSDKIILGNNDDSVHDTAVAYNDDVVIVGNPLYSHVQVSSPIFYDSNNTGYYLDPNSNSKAVTFHLGNGSTFNGGSTYALQLSHNNRHLLALNYNNSANYPWLVNDTWNGGAALIVHFNGVGDRFFVNSGGHMQADGSSRAPIFYDSNDTGYYGDFASTSRLNILNLSGYGYVVGQTTNGQSHYQWEGATFRNPADHTPSLLIRADNATTGINGFRPALSIYNNNGGDQTTAGLVFTSAEGATGAGNSVNLAGIIAKKESAGNVGGWSPGSLTFFVKDFGTRRDGMFIASSGYVQSDYSFRAPIFYDSNNTGYYVDPANSSILDGLRIKGVNNQASGNDYMLWLDKPNNNDWAIGVTGAYDYGLRMDLAAGHAYGIQVLSNNSERFRVNDDYAYHSSDMRSPIFYDSNDTGYFMDPASTSRINSIYIQGGVGGVSNSSSYTEAAIEVRERGFGGAQDDTWATAPRISFHWGGRVASQIAMSSNGWINILNNPGNNYEGFRAGAIYSTGDVTAYYSDIRLKDIQGPLENAIESVKCIETFKYKNNDIAKQNGFVDDDVHIGVSAQSVEAVLPEIVKHAPFDIESKDGQTISKTGEWYKTVQYEKLVPLLIEAIKELSNKVEELENKLNVTN